MENNEFVTYLNTLHNYNAQNSNVFGEKNIKSKFYDQIMVDIPICDYIVKQLTSSPSHIMILTGHAGDGKTSLMYQVMNKLNQDFDPSKKEFSIFLPNGKECLCIKDFSEFSDEEKIEVMKRIAIQQRNGSYVFLVANTGPLINNFPQAFENDKKEIVQTKLIELLDSNTGEINDIFGLKLCVINVVAINNSFFSDAFIEKIIADNLWSNCSECKKKEYCPILKNINLIRTNKIRVKEFIRNHYIWLSEYGDRLTIRSMTQQLSYMITAGLNCKEVKQFVDYLYLSSNLFFGYEGTRIDKKAMEINSVNKAFLCNYDKKRLRIDEQLFISKQYKSLFSSEIEQIILNSENDCGNAEGWQSMIKRMLLFYNIISDDENKEYLLEDVFSKQFNRYVDIKFKNSNINSKDNLLIKDAFSMLNIGFIESKKSDLPITLNRESGYVQNVQYVVGTLKKKKIKLVSKQSNHSSYLGNKGYNDIKISIDGVELRQEINLPLLDYFSDLKQGIINTNIDAQLSKGIETIKSEVLTIASEEHDDNITLIVSNDLGYEEISITLENDTITDGN